MLDLTLLAPPLESDGPPGLDTFDERFQSIVGMVQAGRFQEAAEATAAVLRERRYDIRLIGYFLYGVFLEQGTAAIAPIFETLGSLLTDSWEQIGPERKKERHAQNGLLWFLTRLHAQLQHEQDRDTEQWRRWVEQTSVEQAEAIGERIEALRRVLGETIEAPKVLELLPKLGTWARGFHRLVYDEAERREAAAAEPEPEPEPEVAPAASSGDAAPAAAAAGAAVVPGASGPQVAGSVLLQELIAKLAAFERLVDAGAFERAAVVAADVNERIESFDPRRYFPALFATYYRKLSEHVDELEPHLEDRDTLRWQAMDQHYRVDLDAFAEL
ncbi:MAG: hypothetical protein D6776_07020 [Planctomycetota bacterium]|nr:MAG: hypothetical protein D6776_07020 [Planctomycetota bacterium]